MPDSDKNSVKSLSESRFIHKPKLNSTAAKEFQLQQVKNSKKTAEIRPHFRLGSDGETEIVGCKKCYVFIQL